MTTQAWVLRGGILAFILCYLNVSRMYYLHSRSIVRRSLPSGIVSTLLSQYIRMRTSDLNTSKKYTQPGRVWVQPA